MTDKKKPIFEPTLGMYLGVFPEQINSLPLFNDLIETTISNLSQGLNSKKEAIVRDRCKELNIDINTIIENKNEKEYLRISCEKGEETYFYKELRIVTFINEEIRDFSEPLKYSFEIKSYYY